MLGEDLSAILPADHRRALSAAVRVLIDGLLDDLTGRWPEETLADSQMADHLPPKYVHRYTQQFGRRFLACLYTVAWKLEAPEPCVLACVGEELALNALIECAEGILEDEGTTADFDPLYEAAYEDEDFRTLFDPKWDGIEDSEQGRRLGMAGLPFDDWFTPFRDEDPVHPYVAAPATKRGWRPAGASGAD